MAKNDILLILTPSHRKLIILTGLFKMAMIHILRFCMFQRFTQSSSHINILKGYFQRLLAEEISRKSQHLR